MTLAAHVPKLSGSSRNDTLPGRATRRRAKRVGRS